MDSATRVEGQEELHKLKEESVVSAMIEAGDSASTQATTTPSSSTHPAAYARFMRLLKNKKRLGSQALSEMDKKEAFALFMANDEDCACNATEQVVSLRIYGDEECCMRGEEKIVLVVVSSSGSSSGGSSSGSSGGGTSR